MKNPSDELCLFGDVYITLFEGIDFLAKEIHIPEDLWLFVGRELQSRGFITEDVLIRATIEEPKTKWLLLEKDFSTESTS